MRGARGDMFPRLLCGCSASSRRRKAGGPSSEKPPVNITQRIYFFLLAPFLSLD
jgi:hypothetical protein